MKESRTARPLRFVQAAVALVLAASLFAWLQFHTRDICCSDFDGYYHIKWASLLGQGIRQGHFPPAFTWLPLTALNAGAYADQHLLFHLLLIPFLWFAAPVTAAKISAVFFASLALLACFCLVLSYRLDHKWIWLLALLGSSSLFLFRMSMTRAQSVSVTLIALGIYLLFERKYRWLAPAAFLYLWTYNLFVILAAMALLWTFAGWWSERRWDWRPVLWTVLGLAAGFVINPYFPNDVRLFWLHVTHRAPLALGPGAGSEWYPLNAWDLLAFNGLACALMAAGYLAFGNLLAAGSRRRMQRPLFLLLLATMLLVLTARSKRFVEYWPPMAVLFAAFTFQAANGLRERSPARSDRPGKKIRFAAAAVVLASLAYQAHLARLLIETPVGPEQYRNGALWLREHAPPGAMIFDASWDDFPKLYYYDDQFTYVSGLDPLYFAVRDPNLAGAYQRIVTGRDRFAGPRIRDAFGAQYVFLSAAVARDFYTSAMLSGQFEKVYSDEQCIILKVRDMAAQSD